MPPPDDADGPYGRDRHVDDDTLATVSLGEQVDPDVSEHIAACGRCRAEVESLARVVYVGRSRGADDELLMPPRSVWERIAADAGIDAALLPPAVGRDTTPVSLGSAPPPIGEPAAAARVVDLSSRPRRMAATAPVEQVPTRARSRARLLIAAAVVGGLVGIGATLGWQALGWQPLDRDSPTVVAAATLAPLPDKVGTGSAEVRGGDDARELDLRLDADAPTDAFLQVWLLSSDTERMVPLGVLAGGAGRFALPVGVTLEEYPVVDVSIEPYDGDPLHSTNSLVRGTLLPT